MSSARTDPGKSTLLDIVAGRTRPGYRHGEARARPWSRATPTSRRRCSTPTRSCARSSPARSASPTGRTGCCSSGSGSTRRRSTRRCRMLSGGERRRLQLVMVLATKPNLLVLDEPTNDLDLDTLRAMEGFLDEWPGALVVASHDRTFLDRTVDHVLAIEPGGAVARVPGGVAGWLAGRRQPASLPEPRREGGRWIGRSREGSCAQPVHARSAAARHRAGDGQGSSASSTSSTSSSPAAPTTSSWRASAPSSQRPRPSSPSSRSAGSTSPNNKPADRRSVGG